MNTATATKFFSFLSPTIITGPIFDKELRVASRRKRTYFLRFVYLIAITIFISIVWSNIYDRAAFSGFNGFGLTGSQGSLRIQAQMARIGKMIITNIAWFQFYAMPVLAAILLSSSISDEIRGKTIGVLVSTPISSFQIVMGKMLSKLCQLIFLMAISLPILSMVRVFGGVPWNYIISTFCVTLTLTIFAASLSLFLSIYIKKPFVVIPIVIIFLVASALIIVWLKEYAFDARSYNYNYRIYWINFFSCINPYELLNSLGRSMKNPGRAFVIKDLIWQLNCGISLLFSMVILFIASLKVRKVALMEVSGQLGPLKRWLNTESENEFCGIAKPKKEKPIRPISDNPVIWREARSPVFVKRKFLRLAAMALVSVGSTVVFFICVFSVIMDRGETLPICILGFMIYATIFTVIPPALCIPAEKESRSWPMLMSTSLTDWQILTGKFVGILRKCMFPWSLLMLFLLYILVFSLIHPITILFITMNMISVIALLSGSGLFFGTLFKKANAAVIANIIFAVGIWLALPMLSDFSLFILGDFFDFCLTINPFYESTLVVDIRAYTNMIYRWPTEKLGVGMTFLTIMISTIIHIATGAFFIFCAKKRLRKNIF
ncbi:MAG: ABC transporter permease subunit [Phycisphaerae bacterium]|nr:ABC transporter permease subunit [Phycisphaerae bacterium]